MKPRRIESIALALVIITLLSGCLPRYILFWINPGGIEDFIGDVLVRQFDTFLMLLGSGYFYFFARDFSTPFLIVVAVVLGYRIIQYINTERRLFPPEIYVLTVLAMVFLQFFADLSPRLTCAFLLLALPVFFLNGLRRLIPAFALALLVCVGAWQINMLDWAEAAAAVVFLLLALFSRYIVSLGRISKISAACFLLLAIPIAQLFSAWLPASFTYRHGQQFSPLPALSFCESHEQRAVFAVHPQCPMAMFVKQCKNGFIGVYEIETLQHRRDIRPFDESYYGRPEQIICEKNQLFLGMNAVRQNGSVLGPNTMLVDLSGERVRFWKNFAGPQIGNSILFDAPNNALFMTSEFERRIFRWDFKSNKMDTSIGDEFSNPWYWFHTGRHYSGSLISHHDGISPIRNAAYFAEWINGRFIHEVDLTTLKARRHLRFNGGGSLGVTVDDAENKLWVPHLWGVSVFDLRTGLIVARHRTGFMNRPAVIDTKNNLVFMASTVQGRIHVFDRKTMQPLTRIVLGLGSRYLFISQDMSRLYASSWSGSYFFDLRSDGGFIQSLIRFRNNS